MKTGGRAAVKVAPTPTRNLSRRASLNAAASGLDYGARAAVELVVSPLVVAGLGAATYGAWRVLWQWSSYVWGASGRSAQALQYAIAHRQWTATDHEKRQMVGAAALVWVLFIPLLLLAGGLGVWLVPHLLDVPAEQVSGLRWAAAILVVDALAVTLLTLPRSALVGENLGYTRMGISTALVLVGGLLLVGSVWLGPGPARPRDRHRGHDVADRCRLLVDHAQAPGVVRDRPAHARALPLVRRAVRVVPRLEARARS